MNMNRNEGSGQINDRYNALNEEIEKNQLLEDAQRMGISIPETKDGAALENQAQQENDTLNNSEEATRDIKNQIQKTDFEREVLDKAMKGYERQYSDIPEFSQEEINLKSKLYPENEQQIFIQEAVERWAHGAHDKAREIIRKSNDPFLQSIDSALSKSFSSETDAYSDVVKETEGKQLTKEGVGTFKCDIEILKEVAEKLWHDASKNKFPAKFIVKSFHQEKGFENGNKIRKSIEPGTGFIREFVVYDLAREMGVDSAYPPTLIAKKDGVPSSYQWYAEAQDNLLLFDGKFDNAKDRDGYRISTTSKVMDEMGLSVGLFEYTIAATDTKTPDVLIETIDKEKSEKNPDIFRVASSNLRNVATNENKEVRFSMINIDNEYSFSKNNFRDIHPDALPSYSCIASYWKKALEKPEEYGLSKEAIETALQPYKDIISNKERTAELWDKYQGLLTKQEFCSMLKRIKMLVETKKINFDI